MAELILKVGDSENPKGYMDGDVLCAFSDKRIACAHAQNICNARYIGFKANGLRDTASLTFKMFSEFYQYKFERVSNTEIKRVLLADSSFDIFSDKTEKQIYAGLYIQRRLKHPTHLIFGGVGSEIWFGGKSDFSQAKVDNLWSQITAFTGKLKEDHSLWPCGIRDLKEHLVLKLNVNITDTEANNLVQSEIKEEVIIKKRVNCISYKDISEISGDTDVKIEDPEITVDGRTKSEVSLSIVETKPITVVKEITK